MGIIRKRIENMRYSRHHEIKSATSGADHYPLTLSLDPLDSRYLLSGGSDGIVALYDLESTSPQTTINDKTTDFRTVTIRPRKTKFKHRMMISSVEWYPIDTGAFITASYDGSMCVWDTNEFTDICDILPGTANINPHQAHKHTASSVYKAKFHSNGRLIAAAMGNGTIRLCDLNTGVQTNTLTGHRMSVTNLCWSPLQEHLCVSCGLDGNVMFWDIRKTGHQGLLMQLDWRQDHRSVQRRAHDDFGSSMAPHNSSDTQNIMLTSTHMNIWKHMTSTQSVNEFKRINYSINQTVSAHANHRPVMSVAFSTCGRYLFSAANDRNIHSWDANTGTLIHTSLGANNHICAESKLPYDMCVVPSPKQRSRYRALPSRSCREDNTADLSEYLIVPSGSRIGDININKLKYSNGALNNEHSDSHFGAGIAFNILCNHHDCISLHGHLDTVMSIVYRQPYQQLISASKDGMIFLWEMGAECGNELSRPSTNATHPNVADGATATVGHMDIHDVNNSITTVGNNEPETLDEDAWSDEDEDVRHQVSRPQPFLPPIIQRYINDLKKQQYRERVDPNITASAGAPATTEGGLMDVDEYFVSESRITLNSRPRPSFTNALMTTAVNYSITDECLHGVDNSSSSGSSGSGSRSSNSSSSSSSSGSSNGISCSIRRRQDNSITMRTEFLNTGDANTEELVHSTHLNALRNSASVPGRRHAQDLLGQARDTLVQSSNSNDQNHEQNADPSSNSKGRKEKDKKFSLRSFYGGMKSKR
jgi:DNA excision repair protein ERCC-8